MKITHSEHFERKNFFKQMSERLDDTVKSIEMVQINADQTVRNIMNLYPQGINPELWGLLILCEHNLFFYVHPAEPTIFGLRLSSSKKSKEQIFDFSSLIKWNAEYISKKTLFGIKKEKFCFLLECFYAEENSNPKKFSLILQTQTHADKIITQLQDLQNKIFPTAG
ncbi:MAG: hypothetical protein R3Y36_00535 [Spirochaetales bacterium]